MKSIRVLVNVCILIALFYLSYYLFAAFTQKVPHDGDSWTYHIPIALSILNGGFLTGNFSHVPILKNPVTGIIRQSVIWYYPGSSEAINSIFVLFNLPTFSNIFAAVVLFFALYKLARTFSLSQDLAILFGIAFTTLNIILRWLNVVSIDTWVGVWFVFGLLLLENPKKDIWYFIKLGFTLGMLVGSKYTGFYFVIVFLLFYAKKLLLNLNIARFVMFTIPFSIFGLFWYVRNYLIKGDPFYPLPFLGFKGPYTIASNPSVLIESIRQPLAMFNASFGEFHLWIFSIVIAIMVVIYNFAIKKKFQLNSTNKIFLIGIINFAIFLTFPSNPEPWILVSCLRYSYPAFIPLMLGVFLLTSQYHKEEWLGYFVTVNMLNVLSMAYYPKLILFYLPLSGVVFYFLNKKLPASK